MHAALRRREIFHVLLLLLLLCVCLSVLSSSTKTRILPPRRKKRDSTIAPQQTTTQNDTGMATPSDPTASSPVSRAAYPVPDPLARILKEVLSVQSGDDGVSANLHDKDTESLETALAQLVSNAFEAMDSMYFSA